MRETSKRPARRTRIRTLVDALEPRRLLATPGGVRPDTLASFDKGERIALIDRLDHLSSQATLKSKIGNGSTASLRSFDNALLDYMKSRTNVHYYVDAGEVASTAAFIAGHLTTSGAVAKADAVVDSRLFPASPNASDYATSMSGAINYRAPNGGKGDTFALTVNRFEYWNHLSDAAWLGTNHAKYVDEVRYELAQWSTQFDGNLDVPSDWSSDGKGGWALAMSIRAEMWLQTYFKLLSPDDGGAWGGADDTLMLYKLVQHGDWLYAESNGAKVSSSVDSNKTLSLAKSLYMLGRMFPELDTAAQWLERGRSLLIQSMDAQIYADGSDREQSPQYTLGVAEDLLDCYQLDQRNADTSAWSGAPRQTLGRIIESYRQFLTPDGKKPGIGDTYRTSSVGLFLKAGVILGRIHPTSTTLVGQAERSATALTLADASTFNVGDAIGVEGRSELLRVAGKSGNTISVARGVGGTTALSTSNGARLYDFGDQPFAKPGIADVWLLGVAAATPFVKVPSNPTGVLGARGQSYAMPDSGNYILRSGDDARATQLTFDAGPKGGYHGHFDPLNFELWSGGRPLIVDPGPYKYDGGADRDYVLSTRAHNTINVDGQNTGAMEGAGNPGLIVATDVRGGYAQLTGTHFGYGYLAGAPVITRSVWYDYAGTMLVVDFAEASSSHSFQQSFNVPGDATANVSGASGGTEFKTRYADGSDNVRVRTINGGDLVKGGLTFVTGDPDGDYKDDAYRYTVTKSGTFAVFVTLINTYTGLSVPNVDAQLVTTNPQPGQAVQVKLLRNGVQDRIVSFQQPSLRRPGNTLNVNARVNDIEHDSKGNLHVVFQDRADGFLKYTVKDAKTNKWSAVQTIDDANSNVAAHLDLKLDNNGRPAVAYYDEPNGDLKYATLSTADNAWTTQVVDGKNTVGQNPSLIFSRKGNSAIISYYDRTKRDLKIASQQTATTWDVGTLDADGDVGRYSSLQLDPNRTDLNARWAVAYEDVTHAAYKYAYTSGSQKFETIKGKDVTATGGYVSLAFENSGSGDVGTATSNRYVPRFTFYESLPDASLWIAKKDKASGTWSTARVDGAGGTKTSGAYNQLSYASGKAEVFYFDEKNRQLRHATAGSGTTWTYATVAAGGREVHVSRKGSVWSVSNFDLSDAELTVETA